MTWLDGKPDLPVSRPPEPFAQSGAPAASYVGAFDPTYATPWERFASKPFVNSALRGLTADFYRPEKGYDPEDHGFMWRLGDEAGLLLGMLVPLGATGKVITKGGKMVAASPKLYAALKAGKITAKPMKALATPMGRRVGHGLALGAAYEGGVRAPVGYDEQGREVLDWDLLGDGPGSIGARLKRGAGGAALFGALGGLAPSMERLSGKIAEAVERGALKRGGALHRWAAKGQPGDTERLSIVMGEGRRTMPLGLKTAERAATGAQEGAFLGAAGGGHEALATGEWDGGAFMESVLSGALSFAGLKGLTGLGAPVLRGTAPRSPEDALRHVEAWAANERNMAPEAKESVRVYTDMLRKQIEAAEKPDGQGVGEGEKAAEGAPSEAGRREMEGIAPEQGVKPAVELPSSPVPSPAAESREAYYDRSIREAAERARHLKNVEDFEGAGRAETEEARLGLEYERFRAEGGADKEALRDETRLEAAKRSQRLDALIRDVERPGATEAAVEFKTKDYERVREEFNRFAEETRNSSKDTELVDWLNDREVYYRTTLGVGKEGATVKESLTVEPGDPPSPRLRRAGADHIPEARKMVEEPQELARSTAPDFMDSAGIRRERGLLPGPERRERPKLLEDKTSSWKPVEAEMSETWDRAMDLDARIGRKGLKRKERKLLAKERKKLWAEALKGLPKGKGKQIRGIWEKLRAGKADPDMAKVLTGWVQRLDTDKVRVVFEVLNTAERVMESHLKLNPQASVGTPIKGASAVLQRDAQGRAKLGLVRLLRGADASTPMHEIYHAMLDLAPDSIRRAAKDYYRDDPRGFHEAAAQDGSAYFFKRGSEASPSPLNRWYERVARTVRDWLGFAENIEGTPEGLRQWFRDVAEGRVGRYERAARQEAKQASREAKVSRLRTAAFEGPQAWLKKIGGLRVDQKRATGRRYYHEYGNIFGSDKIDRSLKRREGLFNRGGLLPDALADKMAEREELAHYFSNLEQGDRARVAAELAEQIWREGTWKNLRPKTMESTGRELEAEDDARVEMWKELDRREQAGEKLQTEPPGYHLTTEQQRLLRSINEAKTILLGGVSGPKRAAIERSLAKAESKYEATLKPEVLADYLNLKTKTSALWMKRGPGRQGDLFGQGEAARDMRREMGGQLERERTSGPRREEEEGQLDLFGEGEHFQAVRPREALERVDKMEAKEQAEAARRGLAELKAKQKKVSTSKFPAPDVEVERRIQRAHGIDNAQGGFVARAVAKSRERLERLLKSVSTSTPHLYSWQKEMEKLEKSAPRQYGDDLAAVNQVREVLRRQKENRGWAELTSRVAVENFNERLKTAEEFDLYERLTLGEDLLEYLDQQRKSVWHGKIEEVKLPFGFDNPHLAQSWVMGLRISLKKYPRVREAYAARRRYYQELGAELEAFGVIRKSQAATAVAYFRHNILKYEALGGREAMLSTGERLKLPLGRGWQERRRSSAEDYNTDVNQVDLVTISEMHAALADAKVLKWIKDHPRLNRRKEWDAEAKQRTKELRESWMKERTEGRRVSHEEMEKLKRWTKEKRVSIEDIEREREDEGFVIWKMHPGVKWFTERNIREELADQVAKIMEKAVPGFGDFGKAYNYEKLVIPRALRDHLNDLKSEDYVGRMDAWTEALQPVTTLWKRMMLFIPNRVVRYNVNNSYGDLEGALIAEPGVFKNMDEWRQVFHDLREFFVKHRVASKEAEEAIRAGVFSGLTLSELSLQNKLPNVKRLNESMKKELAKARGEAIAKVTAKTVADFLFGYGQRFSEWRESVLRYKAYLHYRNNPGGGQLGASRAAELKGLTTEMRNGKLARELLIDYGDISAFGQVLRKNMVPFWSWTEGNMKRFKRVLANVFAEGTGRQRLMLAATPAARVGIGIMLVTGLGEAWNRLFTDEEQRESMDEYTKKRGYLVIPGTGDERGGIRYIRAASALRDLGEWIGWGDYPDVFAQMKNGQAGLADLLGVAPKGAANKLIGGLGPFPKGAYEFLSGKRVFPDVFNQGRQGKKDVALAHMWGIGREYLGVKNLFTGTEPGRGTLDWALGLLAMKYNDPGASAYYKTMDTKHRFTERVLGRHYSGGGYYTAKSQMVRQYRTAVRYGDAEVAKAAEKKLKEMGVTAGDLRKYMAGMHPRSGIARKYWKQYEAWMSPEQRRLEKQAIQFYEETYR